jgi:hypothetical protein
MVDKLTTETTTAGFNFIIFVNSEPVYPINPFPYVEDHVPTLVVPYSAIFILYSSSESGCLRHIFRICCEVNPLLKRTVIYWQKIHDMCCQNITQLLESPMPPSHLGPLYRTKLDWIMSLHKALDLLVIAVNPPFFPKSQLPEGSAPVEPPYARQGRSGRPAPANRGLASIGDRWIGFVGKIYRKVL